jgi:DNA-binding NarL/FixJ family response regulator
MVAGSSSPVIVLADADGDFLAFLSDLLEPIGYPTIAVSSGEEALDTVRREEACLLVLDDGLPGLSGYEVCRRLRDELGDRLPIVFVSGERTESFDRAAGLLVGADDYLVKPVAPDEFLARVRRLLSRSASSATPQFELTRREHEILSLLAEGMATDEIERRLVISHKTVATHLSHIYTKLGVDNRAQAVAVAYREELVRPD